MISADRGRRQRGRIQTHDEVERLKNRRSRRALVIPIPLMTLLRHTIDEFCRDESRQVKTSARLIPGLRTASKGLAVVERLAGVATGRSTSGGLPSHAPDERL